MEYMTIFKNYQKTIESEIEKVFYFNKKKVIEA
jgi:hypothetical protein